MQGTQATLLLAEAKVPAGLVFLQEDMLQDFLASGHNLIRRGVPYLDQAYCYPGCHSSGGFYPAPPGKTA